MGSACCRGGDARSLRGLGDSPELRYVERVSRRTLVTTLFLMLALATPATAAAPPEVVKLRKQVAVLKAQVSKVTRERNAARSALASAAGERDQLRAQVGTLASERDTLRSQVAVLTTERDQLKARLAPLPSGSVAVAPGQNGDRIVIHGARINGDGNLLGQMEYLGGLNCRDLGPWLKVEATFFNSVGQVIDSGSDTETNPIAGTRYPLDVFGPSGAVRADAVASVTCI